jgi:hypothetical protein
MGHFVSRADHCRDAGQVTRNTGLLATQVGEVRFRPLIIIIELYERSMIKNMCKNVVNVQRYQQDEINHH